MTVLALKLSRRANAVSALHGEVSRAMWTGLYPNKPEDSVPIGHITNGVHVSTWLAPQMFRLYDRHFGSGWHQLGAEASTWEGIEDVDDGELWETHLSLKSRLIEFVRRRAVEQAEYRGEPPQDLRRIARVLSPDALTIGFGRRFATYKRANLFLKEIEMLASMVNDSPGGHGLHDQMLRRRRRHFKRHEPNRGRVKSVALRGASGHASGEMKVRHAGERRHPGSHSVQIQISPGFRLAPE